MALGHSPQIVTNGLVFAYDMANTKKSWKGKPTTNIIGNGCFAGGAGIENESGSYGNNNIVMLLNPGNTPYVLRQGPGGGEYEIHPKAGYAASLNANTTYCMSIWVAYTSDWNGNSLTLHSRWYDGAGNPYTTATDGTIFDTLNLGLVWQRRYTTFTTPSTVSGSYQWYLGYPTDNTTGFRYITGVQLEEGTFPTAFVDGTRSNTQAILDLTNNNTITASSLTYNSDGTFSFNGSSSYLSPNVISDSMLTTGSWTMSAVVKFYTVNRGIDNAIFGHGTAASSQGLHLAERSGYVYFGMYANDLGGSKPISANTWFEITFVFDFATKLKTIYVNGEYDTSGGSVGYSGAGSNFRIGQYPWSTGHTANGEISAVRIYNRALTAAEVRQNFNALRGRYSI